MRRTNIYLADDQCEALDRLAGQEGASRAEVIRRIIDSALAEGARDVEADLTAIEESFGVLADTTYEIRAVDDRARHLDELWQLES